MVGIVATSSVRSLSGAVVTVFAVALGWFSVGLASASPWRDEAVSVVMAGRSLPELASVLAHVDLVHGLYYLVGKPVVVLWPSVVGLRVVSALAMAATGALLVLIGHALAARRVGLMAAAAFLASPVSSHYAQEARPFALAALFATASTLVLVTGTVRPGTGQGPTRRRWAGYAALLAVAVLFNVISSLVLFAHAAVVIVNRPGLVRRWGGVVVGTMLLLAPFLVGALAQKGQIDWRGPADSGVLEVALAGPFGGLWIPCGVLLWVLFGAFVRGPFLPAVSRPCLVVGLAWGLAPTLALWSASRVLPQLTSIFDPRYLVFTLPGLALALASGAGPSVPDADRARLSRAAASALLVVPVVLLAGGGIPDQRALRTATGHAEDMDGVYAVLSREARPADAVLFLPSYLRIFADYYGPRLPDVIDIARPVEPGPLVTVTQTDRPPAETVAALRGHDRVWVVASTGARAAPASAATDAAKLEALRASYEIDHCRQVLRFEVCLFTRVP